MAKAAPTTGWFPLLAKVLEDAEHPITVTEANALSQAIDALNDRLTAAEKFLAEFPAKSNVIVPIDGGQSVSMYRTDAGWHLMFDPGDNEPDKRWTKCSAKEKALVAQTLPALLSTIREQVSDRVEDVLSAHAALDVFDSTMRSAGGGK